MIQMSDISEQEEEEVLWETIVLLFIMWKIMEECFAKIFINI